MLRLYNTLSHQKETFTPLDLSHVKMYVCGPTVYGPAHVGNARPVVVFDLLYRLLKKLYPCVTYVRNITDIDDKILHAANETNQTPFELTQKTLVQFHNDIKQLNVEPPTFEPKATEHINEMIKMIASLIEKGHAYESSGHVLFDVCSFKNYGALSNRKCEEMIAGARVEVASYKKNPADFVLWKPATDVYWESPWGKGRPGWHIECSAMAAKYFGQQFDLHGGGIDLTFPHHENEIAQTCCAFDTPSMARFWMHNGHVTVNHEKMSKSLGNIVTICDALEKNCGSVLKIALLSTHYKQPLDWTQNLIAQSQANFNRFQNVITDAKITCAKDLPQDIIELLCDDLNVGGVFVKMHEYANAYFKTKDTLWAKKLFSCLLFLGLKESKTCTLSKEDIAFWLAKREKAKKEKNYEEADQIRHMFKAHNITIHDTKDGVRIV